MWNVFDASFIIIFLVYVVSRSYGLYSGDGLSLVFTYSTSPIP
jgi:hypothetical protein